MSDGFVSVKGSTHFFDMGAMTANSFMELVAGDAEFFGPVGDVGGHFRIDFFGIVGTLGGVVFMYGVGFVAFGSVMVLGHRIVPLLGSLGWMSRRWMGMSLGMV
jgi:hypothetical protein